MEADTITWTIVIAWYIGSLFLTPLFCRTAFRSSSSEEDRLDDQAQYRWVCEQQFVRDLEKHAKRHGHEMAWRKAAQAARRKVTPNGTDIKRWTNQQLLDAIRSLREDRRTPCG
jgi:hypothetical protein